jgi:hypothetical protein
MDSKALPHSEARKDREDLGKRESKPTSIVWKIWNVEVSLFSER